MTIGLEAKVKPNRSAPVVVGAQAVSNATKEVSKKSNPKKRSSSGNPQKKENPSAGTIQTKKKTSISVGPDSKDSKPTGDGSNLGVSSGTLVVASVASRYLEAIHTPRGTNTNTASDVPSGGSTSFSEDDAEHESSVGSSGSKQSQGAKKSQGCTREKEGPSVAHPSSPTKPPNGPLVAHPSSPTKLPYYALNSGSNTSKGDATRPVFALMKRTLEGGLLAPSIENVSPKDTTTPTTPIPRKLSTKPVSIPKAFESVVGDTVKTPILAKTKQDVIPAMKSAGTGNVVALGGLPSSLGSPVDKKKGSNEKSDQRKISVVKGDVATGVPEPIAETVPPKVAQLRRMYLGEDRNFTEGANPSTANPGATLSRVKSACIAPNSTGGPASEVKVDNNNTATEAMEPKKPPVKTLSSHLSQQQNQTDVETKGTMSGEDQMSAIDPPSYADESSSIISPRNMAQLDIEALQKGRKVADHTREVAKPSPTKGRTDQAFCRSSSSDSNQLVDCDIEQRDTLLAKPSLGEESVSGPCCLDYSTGVNVKSGRNSRKWWLLILLVLLAGGGIASYFMLGGSNHLDTSALENQLAYLSSDPSVFQYASSPQRSALNWLVDTAEVNVGDKKRIETRYALAVLYFATGGPNNWHQDLGFLSDRHECEWTRSSDLGSGGIGCDRDGRIINLQISKYRCFLEACSTVVIVRLCFLLLSPVASLQQSHGFNARGIERIVRSCCIRFEQQSHHGGYSNNEVRWLGVSQPCK
jgi:hypothetical protein